MNLEHYLTMLRWEGGIGIRAIRVRDLTDREEHTCYDVILIPQEMDDDEDGVSYRIDTDDEGLEGALRHHPDKIAVLGAWPLRELINGAMYIEDTVNDYFESEV